MLDRKALTKRLREAADRMPDPKPMGIRATHSDELVERWLDEREFVDPDMTFISWVLDNLDEVARVLNADPLPGEGP